MYPCGHGEDYMQIMSHEVYYICQRPTGTNTQNVTSNPEMTKRYAAFPSSRGHVTLPQYPFQGIVRHSLSWFKGWLGLEHNS